MQSIEDIADEIVAREGGYVNDPDDPGGPTKHGVTLATMRRLGLDLDRDGDVDLGDVKRVTPAVARQVFLRHYFYGPGLAGLPALLQPPVFDMHVHSGSRAVRLLQQLVREMGEDVVVDGICGPLTRAAAHRALAAAPGHMVDAYGIARRDWYYRLAQARPASRKYVRRRDGGKGGWIVRAEAFLAPRWHLSDADHAARVAGWA